MDGVLPILFLAVILKIPVLFGLWLIYWAMKDEPQVEEDLPGGSEDHSFRRYRRNPLKPGPRTRGPHGGGATVELPGPDGGRTRTPAIKPRLAPGMAAHERRERTPAGS
ncbi:MAG TPA: hypothetical protein VH501_06440 [Solirubrobacterales bacterium]|jgi:hypothetical protein